MHIRQLEKKIQFRSEGWAEDKWEAEATLVRRPLLPYKSRASSHWPATPEKCPRLSHGMFSFPPVLSHPHGGVRPFLQKSTFFTKLTEGPYVVKTRSLYPRRFGSNQPTNPEKFTERMVGVFGFC